MYKKLLALLLLSPLIIASDEKSYDELSDNKAMAVNIETGESFFVGNKKVLLGVNRKDRAIGRAKVLAVEKCDKDFNIKAIRKKYWPYPASSELEDVVETKEFRNSVCQIFRTNDEIIYQSVNDYFVHIDMLEEAERRYKENQEYARNMKAQQQEQERLRQQELILTALVDRCSSFGWKTEDNIASCVKQEAYRDLKIQEQEYKMELLEKRLIAANTPEERPLFLDILDFVIEEADKKENAQLRRDIMMLKADTRSLKNRQNTQAALNALYRNSN